MAAIPKYTVMGCAGARPRAFTTLKAAVKAARACARRGASAVNVSHNRAPTSPWTEPFGTSRIVYRCTRRAGAAVVCRGGTGDASTYASWERQAQADKYLRGGRRRRSR